MEGWRGDSRSGTDHTGGAFQSACVLTICPTRCTDILEVRTLRLGKILSPRFGKCNASRGDLWFFAGCSRRPSSIVWRWILRKKTKINPKITIAGVDLTCATAAEEVNAYLRSLAYRAVFWSSPLLAAHLLCAVSDAFRTLLRKFYVRISWLLCARVRLVGQ